MKILYGLALIPFQLSVHTYATFSGIKHIFCIFFLGEMIDKLTLTYNRTRQAVITKELIEIISGAAALD